MRSAHLASPIVGARWRTVGITFSIPQVGNGHYSAREIGVLVILKFLGADWWQTGDKDEFVLRRQLHHFARREQRAGRLLLGYHDVAEPRGETVTGIVAL